MKNLIGNARNNLQKGIKITNMTENYYNDPVNPPQINCPLRVTEESNGIKTIDFYLINEIEDIKDYLDFLREIENTKPTDLVKVHINCYGGAMDVAWNLCDALQRCEAPVHVIVEGACMSAATLIMLTGNSWYVAPHAVVMVHSWSGWNYGKWNEQKEYHDFAKLFREKQFREVYKNFMSENELDLCLQGKDYYFDADETAERLNKFVAEDARKEELIGKIQEKYRDIINKEVQAVLEGKQPTSKDSVFSRTAKAVNEIVQKKKSSKGSNKKSK